MRKGLYRRYKNVWPPWPARWLPSTCVMHAQLWTSLWAHRCQQHAEESSRFVQMSVLLQRTAVRLLELLPGEGDIGNQTLINRELGYSNFLCKHEKCEAETQITSCLRKLTVALKENFLKIMSFKVLACLWSGYISHLKYNIRYWLQHYLIASSSSSTYFFLHNSCDRGKRYYSDFRDVYLNHCSSKIHQECN